MAYLGTFQGNLTSEQVVLPFWRKSDNEEEEVTFLYTNPNAKGPNKGQKGVSDGHIASEAQRDRSVSFKSACSVEWRCPSWNSGSHLSHTPALCPPAERDLGTPPWTSPPWDSDLAAVIRPSSACSLQHKGPSRVPWLPSLQVCLESAGTLPSATAALHKGVRGWGHFPV